MQRRHFLALSGTSLASLLVLPATAHAAPAALVRLPLKVRVRLEGEPHELTSTDKLTWHYREVTVRLLPQGDALAVHVQCPAAALRAVVLEWHYAPNLSATLLGDAWERTYGDVQFEPASLARRLPWYFVQHGARPADTVCFGVKTGCHALCYWQVGSGLMQLTLDTSSGGVGVQLGHRELAAATIIATAGKAGEDTFATARRFCGQLCPSPRLPRQPVYGINDWYFAYGNNSADLILQHTKLLADLMPSGVNRPFSVVDAGWAAYSPQLPGDCCWQEDFSRPNAKFPDMAQLGGAIRQLGMRPGLWTRPLCAAHDDAPTRLLPSIVGRNDPKRPVLDPTIAENVARIQHNFATYQSWGYELVKHDFTTYDLLGRWGFEMADGFTAPGWRFHDNTRTTAEIILDLYKVIRQATGPAYLIGCNTVGHLAAGLFELNRTGDDTSGLEWDRTRKMGVNTLGFRLVQHNKFFAADGDCVGLTPKVPWAKNEQWLRLLAGSGAPLLVSAQPEAVGAAQRTALQAAFAQAAKVQPVGEPLDWLAGPRPTKWRLAGQIVEFDWS